MKNNQRNTQVQPLISIIKDSQSPVDFRRACIDNLFSLYMPEEVNRPLHVFVQSSIPKGQSKTMPSEIEILLHYFKSWIQESVITSSHSLSLQFLSKLYKCGYLSQDQTADISNTLISTVEAIDSSDLNLEFEFQFVMGVLQWVQLSLKIHQQELQQELVLSLIHRRHINNEQIGYLLNSRIYSQTGFIQKVVFFIKLHNTDPRSTKIFIKLAEVLQLCTKRVARIGEGFRKLIILRADQNSLIEFYHRIQQLNSSKKDKQTQHLLHSINQQLQQMQRDGSDPSQFLKAQKILTACEAHILLFRIVHLHPDLSQYVYNILSLAAANNPENSELLLQYIIANRIEVFNGSNGECMMIANMAGTGVLSQPLYYSFVTDLIATKIYNPQSSNNFFVQALLSLSTSINKEKIYRLIPNAATLKNILNIPQAQQFSGTGHIEYAINCLQLLINIHPEHPTQLSSVVFQCLNFIQLFNLPLPHKRNFFIFPSISALLYLKFQTLIYKLTYIYNFYQLLQPQDLNLIIMQSIHYHSIMLRQITIENNENALRFIEGKGLQMNQHDILEYCFEYLYTLISISVYQIEERSLDEGIRSSLKIQAHQLVAKVIDLLGTYMSEGEYRDRMAKANRLMKLLKKYFKEEPQLQYYWSVDQRQKETRVVLDESIFKKQKVYFEKYWAQKLLSEYYYSPEYIELKSRQHIRRNEQLSRAINKNQGTFIYHLLLMLQDGTVQEQSLACKLLLDFTELNNLRIADAAISNRFTPLFFTLLQQRPPFIRTLLSLANKLLKPSNLEVNKNIQYQFESEFLKVAHTQSSLSVYKSYLQELLQMEATQTSFHQRLQRTIRFKQSDPETQYFEAGIYVILFLQYLCSSLNPEVKQILGSPTPKSKSILWILVEILKVLTRDPATTSNYKNTLILQCVKTIGTLLREPKSKNIFRALHYGYHRVLLSILRMEDDLATILDRASGDDTFKHSISRVYLNYLAQGQQNYYQLMFSKELLQRQETFDIHQIATLKNLAISQVIQLAESFNPNTLQMLFQVSKRNLTSFIEKAEYVYGATLEDLEKMALSGKMPKEEKINVPNPSNSKSRSEVQKHIKESLHLEFGTNLFIFACRYEEKEGINTIKKSVYKHLNELRLRKKYNQKGGIFYQIYTLVLDILKFVIGLITKLFAKCKRKPLTHRKQQTNEQLYLKGIDFFVRNIASIEAKIDGKIISISFPLLLQEKCINKSIKRNLTEKIGYSSSSERLRTFMQQMDITLLRIREQRKLSKSTARNKLLELLIKNRELWKNLSFTIGIVQNIMLLFKISMRHQTNQTAFWIARACQYFMALLLLLVFLFQSFPLRLVISRSHTNQSKQQNPFRSCLSSWWFIFTDRTFVFAITYVALTTLGIFYDVAVSLLLIDFFYRFKATRFLLQMVVEVWQSIFTNILFFIVLMYLVIVLWGNHDTQQLFGVYCYSYAECLQMSFHTIYRILGDQYVIIDRVKLGVSGVFSTSLTIILLLAFRGLFIGIIIDQKRKVRKNKMETRKQIKERCFICGESKLQVNVRSRMSKGFKRHIEVEHNLWNYIYYLSYLTGLHPSKITEQQQMILNQLKAHSYEWIPLSQKSPHH